MEDLKDLGRLMEYRDLVLEILKYIQFLIEGQDIGDYRFVDIDIMEERGYRFLGVRLVNLQSIVSLSYVRKGGNLNIRV